MKRFLLPMLLALTGSFADAASLDAQHIGCDCGAPEGHNIYVLNWAGPWSEELIYLSQGITPYDYSFYAGYLPENGQDASPPHGYWYTMWACDPQSTCDINAQTLVPWQQCEEID